MRLSSCSPSRVRIECPETVYRPGSEEAMMHYQRQIEQDEPLSMPLLDQPGPKYEYVDESEVTEK